MVGGPGKAPTSGARVGVPPCYLAVPSGRRFRCKPLVCGREMTAVRSYNDPVADSGRGGIRRGNFSRGRGMANEQKDNPQDQPQKERGQVDPFWLRTVFPDPLEVFAFSARPVRALFADALFCFDTNALLAPYQVSNQSADEIERIYRELAKHDRLFVPEQAAREFGKNRGLKLAEMHDEVHKLVSSLPKAEPIDCPMLEGLPAYKELSGVVGSIRESLKNCTFRNNDRAQPPIRTLQGC